MHQDVKSSNILIKKEIIGEQLYEIENYQNLALEEN